MSVGNLPKGSSQTSHILLATITLSADKETPLPPAPWNWMECHLPWYRVLQRRVSIRDSGILPQEEREEKELDKEPTPVSTTQHTGGILRTCTRFTAEFADKSSEVHYA